MLVKNTAIALFCAALLAAAAAPAMGQSSPGWSYGYVPTSSQWNSAFASKQDALGFRPINSAGDSMVGILKFAASNTGYASINIPLGVTPTAPNQGDIWSTSSGIYVFFNGLTYQIFPVLDSTGHVAAAQFPALTGDVTTPGGSLTTTLATVNANVGTFGSATQAPVITYDAKGRATAVSNVTVTPAIGSVTGLGSGVQTALGNAANANGGLATVSVSAIAPASPLLFQPWLNTAAAPYVWNIWDGASWVSLGTINASTHIISIPASNSVFQPAWTGANTAQTLEQRLERVILATDFMGVDPTNTTDSTTGLQNAINSACSTGKELYVPAGNYKITNIVIACNYANVHGAGQRGTIFHPTSLSGNAITVGQAGTVYGANQIGNFGIIADLAPTRTGADLYIVDENSVYFQDINIYGGAIGVQVENSAPAAVNLYGAYFDRLAVSTTTDSNIVVGATATTAYGPADVYFSNLQSNGATNYGMKWVCGSGLHITIADGVSNGVGMIIAPGNGQNVSNFTFDYVQWDTNKNAGLQIAPTGTGYVAHGTLNQLWTTSNGTSPVANSPGTQISGPAASVIALKFTGFFAINNGGAGLEILSGAKWLDVDGIVNQNNVSNTASVGGVHIGAGVSNWSFYGRAGVGDWVAPSNNQKYGVIVDAGASDYYTVSADLSGNVTGTLSDGGTGVHKSIHVLGDVTNISGFSETHTVSNSSSPQYAIVTPPDAISNALAGVGGLQLAVGPLNTDEGVRWGVDTTAHVSWMQCAKPGTIAYPCLLNPQGGKVGVNLNVAPTYDLDIGGVTRTSTSFITKAGTISLSAGCGTGAFADAASSANSGAIGTGTGAGSCTVTLPVGSFPTKAVCIVANQGGGSTPALGALAASAFSFTAASSTNYNYICNGN